MTTNSQYRMGDYYDISRGQGRYEKDFRGHYDDEWESDNCNNSWNYYPETEDRFNSDKDYDKKEEYDFRQDKDDKHEKDSKTMCHCGNCRPSFKPCFRPCFPCFPCFRNCNRDFDCRNNKNNNDDWKGNKSCKCPCHDYDDGYNKKPDGKDKDCDKKSNRIYFSGCIEIKNFDKKF